MKKETLKTAIPEFKISLKCKNKSSELLTVSNPEDVARFARKCFDADKIEWVESFIVIALSQSNKVMGFYKISQGGLTGTVADPKMIFQFALLSNAASIILAHNHPSGNLKASQADIFTTNKLKSAGELLDIKVIDSVIITTEGYYSLFENGDVY